MIQLPLEPVLNRTVGRWLAIAGISAPIVFTASAIAHSLTRDDHSPLSDPLGALAAGPSGWVQDATFAATGLLVIAFGLGLHLTLRPGRHVDPGPQFLALFGLGMIGAARWPAADLVILTSAWLAALALAPRLAKDPAWKAWPGLHGQWASCCCCCSSREASWFFPPVRRFMTGSVSSSGSTSASGSPASQSSPAGSFDARE